MDTSTPRVAIILLNWNSAADTLACLDSLSRLEYRRAEVLVVDNGSTDGSVEAIRGAHPWVRLIESGQNLGFAGGNNLGLRWALARDFDYALLLNNDTVVAPDFLEPLVQAVEQDPAVGIAGPTIYYYDSPETIWSAGCVIDWKRGDTYHHGLDQTDRAQFGTEPRRVDFVTGCALFVKREVLERVGLLDERFFAYYEEAEWCVRASRAGYQILHVPRSRVWHKISTRARADSPLVTYYSTRNRLLFLKTTRAGLRAWVQALVIDDIGALINWTIKPKWREKRGQRKTVARAIRDYFFNQFGPAPFWGS